MERRNAGVDKSAQCACSPTNSQCIAIHVSGNDGVKSQPVVSVHQCCLVVIESVTTEREGVKFEKEREKKASSLDTNAFYDQFMIQKCLIYRPIAAVTSYSLSLSLLSLIHI